MLGIVTTFRAQVLAKDWNYHVWLLERTLDSILAQAHDAFIVAVVCHDIPDMRHVGHPRVRFLSVEFPPPDRNNDDMCTDKVLKLSVGAEWAILQGCDYIMFADADDLFNRRLSEFVASQQGVNGWYSQTQIFYAYGSHLVRSVHPAPADSGPLVIVKSSLLKFVAEPFSGPWLELPMNDGEESYIGLLTDRSAGRRVSTLAATGHTNYRKLMVLEGSPLQPLPFAAYVMINHFDSTTHAPGGAGSDSTRVDSHRSLRKHLSRLKRLGLNVPNIRPLTKAFREEFTIPAPRSIPDAYRRMGSIFSRVINVES
jgi:hypothetical protein